MPGPSQMCYSFFPLGFLRVGLFWPPLAKLSLVYISSFRIDPTNACGSVRNSSTKYSTDSTIDGYVTCIKQNTQWQFLQHPYGDLYLL